MIDIYCFKCKTYRVVPGNFWECAMCGTILNLDDNPDSESDNEDSDKSFVEEDYKDSQGIRYETFSKTRGPFHIMIVQSNGEGWLDTYTTESDFKKKLMEEMRDKKEFKDLNNLNIDQLIEEYKNFDRDNQSFIIEGGKVIMRED